MQKQSKIYKNRPKMNQKSNLEGSRGGLGGSWRPRSKKYEGNANFWGLLGPSWGRLGGLGGLLARRGGVLGPSWRSCRPLVRLKIHAKIDRKSDASWNRFLERFWWIWKKNRGMLALKSNKNRCQLRKAIFWKNLVFPLGKTMIFRVQGIEVGGKTRWKIAPKMESRWEGILASILNGFWWNFGSKLGRKIEACWH